MSAEKGKPEAKKHNTLPSASTGNSDTTTARPPSSDGAPDWLSAPAHTLDADTCIKAFKTDPKFGLDEATVTQYQSTFGPNRLKETPPPSFWAILLRNSLNGQLKIKCCLVRDSTKLSTSADRLWGGYGQDELAIVGTLS